MLSSHLLGPLFMEYESNARALERELRGKDLEVARQAEEVRMLVRENEEMAQRMEVQQREYLRMVEETRDHAQDFILIKGAASG